MRAVVKLFFLFILTFNVNTNAFTLDSKLPSENMERRAISLFNIIKCPICSGESLSESRSQLAHEMRETIRKKISEGNTDKEIISELKDFYGDSIVIIPPVKPSTYILWCAPLIVLLIGFCLMQSILSAERQNKV
ncbi:MAG: Cytochrome c-type biogenesis protein CcmH [Wolbachia endosymbiont of Ctenocephalides orientis wCori]|nr:MAG: Cytochrome c-type biogenesis protein CcmH [Wolbachia endosymbiont of Ctenocephalides orientis wCori]